jgi:hypothetical protein
MVAGVMVVLAMGVAAEEVFEMAAGSMETESMEVRTVEGSRDMPEPGILAVAGTTVSERSAHGRTVSSRPSGIGSGGAQDREQQTAIVRLFLRTAENLPQKPISGILAEKRSMPQIKKF